MAVRTDAAGDYLARTANLPGYTSFTIMGWGRVRVDQGSGAYQPILVALDASFNSFGLYWDAGTPHPGELRVFGAVGGVESSGASLASRPAVDDKFCWYVKCSGTGAGLLEAGWRGSDTRTWVTAAATMPSAASAVTEYRLANVIGSYYLNAAHRNVKCWSRVLTADEINVESYFERPMFPASLNFWWPLDGAGDTNDRGGLARNPTVGGTLTTEDLAVGLWKPSRKIFIAAPSGAFTASITEAGAAAEASSNTFSASASATETATGAETSAGIMAASAASAEAGAAAESSNGVVAKAAALTEAAAASEASSASMTSAAAVVEAASATETSAAGLAAAAVITEAANASEVNSAAAAGNYSAGVIEPASATESAASSMACAAAAAEAGNAGETSSASSAGNFTAAATETASASSTQAASMASSAFLVEAAAASESASAVKNTFVSCLETATPIDVSSAVFASISYARAPAGGGYQRAERASQRTDAMSTSRLAQQPTRRT